MLLPETINFPRKNNGSEGFLSIQQEIEDRTPYVVVV